MAVGGIISSGDALYRGVKAMMMTAKSMVRAWRRSFEMMASIVKCQTKPMACRRFASSAKTNEI